MQVLMSHWKDRDILFWIQKFGRIPIHNCFPSLDHCQLHWLRPLQPQVTRSRRVHQSKNTRSTNTYFPIKNRLFWSTKSLKSFKAKYNFTWLQFNLRRWPDTVPFCLLLRHVRPKNCLYAVSNKETAIIKSDVVFPSYNVNKNWNFWLKEKMIQKN